MANENGGQISKSRREEIIGTDAQRDYNREAVQHPAYLIGERYSKDFNSFRVELLDSGLLV